MVYIVIGQGSTRAVLEVYAIPEEGDEITVRKEQIAWVASDNAFVMVGNTFRLKDKRTTKIASGETVPWFSVVFP